MVIGMNKQEVEQTTAEDTSLNEQDYEARTSIGTGAVYQIKLKGHLDSSWSQWLNNLSITHEQDGVTRLAGPIPDQSALHGLLIKIRDLGLPLLSVNCISTGQEENPGQPI
jgi:hypothetical protein